MHCLLVIFALVTCITAIPSGVSVRPLTKNSVSISWFQAYNSKLKGFTIHYHNGDGIATQWLTKYVWDARASQAVVDGLRSDGEYSFCVRSIMTGMVCACSDMVHINVATGRMSTDAELHSADHSTQQQHQHQQQQQQQHYDQQRQQYEHERRLHYEQRPGQEERRQEEQQPGQEHHDDREQEQHRREHVQHEPRPEIPEQEGQRSEYSVELLEAVSVGSDHVQLRWRYDGARPVKYILTYRGLEHEVSHTVQREIDRGGPVELTAENYVANALRPDTTYVFEVVAVDPHTSRVLSRPQFVRIHTKAFML